MSLLSEIINYESPVVSKQLAYLIIIIKNLGWQSLMDKRTIKPNLRRCQLYIRKHAAEMAKLFAPSFQNLKKDSVVDTINPFLIQMWHIQIIGSPEAASLELLQTITSNKETGKV